MNLAPLDWALGDDLADEKPCGMAVPDAAGRLTWCNEPVTCPEAAGQTASPHQNRR